MNRIKYFAMLCVECIRTIEVPPVASNEICLMKIAVSSKLMFTMFRKSKCQHNESKEGGRGWGARNVWPGLLSAVVNGRRR